ncbi:MAG: ZIP family metal transporter [Acidobacteria bacterium]|nr:ZIP family metal transporter [Acidobacteriota bacterium]
MSAISLIGSVTFFFLDTTRDKVLLPLVAFSAGALLGGAFFHMIPASLAAYKDNLFAFVWVIAGFTLFFALEQFLHWHHFGKAKADCKKPLTYLILIGDGLHDFIGGLAIAGTFLIDVRLGITAWLAAAAHELPQELGDMGVLLYGGWSKRKAVLYNVGSSLTFLAGGLVAYMVSIQYDIAFLIPFAAGNFIYIGASDLVPEVNKHESLKANFIHFMAFVFGIGLLFFVKYVLD